MPARPKCPLCGNLVPEGMSSCPRHRDPGLTTPLGGKAQHERAVKQYQPISEVTIPVVTPQFGKLPGGSAPAKRPAPAPSAPGSPRQVAVASFPQARAAPVQAKSAPATPARAPTVATSTPEFGPASERVTSPVAMPAHVAPRAAERGTAPEPAPSAQAAAARHPSSPAHPPVAAAARSPALAANPAQPSSASPAKAPSSPGHPTVAASARPSSAAAPALDSEPPTDASRLSAPPSAVRHEAPAPSPRGSAPASPTRHEAPAARPRVPLGIEVIPSGTVPLVRRPPPASDQQTQMHDPLIGASIGEFQVTEMIGVGGMGMVYKGVHPLIGKTVAIKVLRPDVADDPEQVKRLLDEARALTAVRHRGIVDVFSFGTLPDGRPYLVMEYLQGQSMQELLEAGGRIELADALPIFDDVLTGLAAAHKVGLVHRDMKPSNIFLARESDGVTAKLVDFGIAKQGRPGAMTPQTVMFRCVGTPEFVSPEQACGKPVGPQSDLYSFGICAFFALTGRLPFEGEVDTEILMKQVEYPPPDPTSLEPSIPAPVSALIMRLMAKKPAERPASADQVRAELAAIGKRLKEPAPAAAAPAPGKPAQPTAPVDDEEARELRSWHRFRLTTALLLVLAVGCAVAWWFLRTK